MGEFDAVLFDLDGTLCRNTQDTEAMYVEAFEQVGAKPFGEPAELWAALDGPPDHDDWIGYLGAGFARLAAQYGRTEVDPLALADALATISDNSAVTPLDGTARAIEVAAGQGATGVVTNGPKRRQKLKLETLELIHRFDTVVYAAELHRQKPHTDPFEAALADLDLPAERVLYVGNSLEYDVAGGQNAGLAVAWLREDGGDPAPYSPEYVLDSLTELPAILEGRDDG